MTPETRDWQRRGAVLLLSCYELGRPPLTLAMAAAFLRQAGFAPRSLDLSVNAMNDDDIDAARVVLVSVPMHTALQLGRRVVARLRRRNPTCRVVWFGHYAHLHGDALLVAGADAVIGGEPEAALVSVVQALRDGRHPEARAHVLTPLRFPLPDRSDLPDLSAYAHLQWQGEHRPAGVLETTRGCRHRCRHCPLPAVYDGRLFAVPRDVVVADARAQIAAGARHLSFVDADFLNAPGQGLRVLEALHAEFPQVTFDFTAKIEHLLRHAPRLPRLAEQGVLFVTSAVETLNDRVLAILDKGHTAADVRRAHALLRDAGIALRPSLLPFTPWTQPDDLGDLLQWIEADDLVDSVDAVQYSIRLLVPRGSLLEHHTEMQAALQHYDDDALTWVWRHADARLEALQRDLAGLAEQAAAAGEDIDTTFARVRDRVDADLPPRMAHRGRFAQQAQRRRQRAPRLTEAWFC